MAESHYYIPELDEMIKKIRSHGMLASLITNGYLLTPERIKRLNHAGLITFKSVSTT